MGRGPERDEAELLVFDADAPPTNPVRGARPGTPGRRRGSSRGVGIAVAVLVILTAGVAAGSILEPSAPDAPSGPLAADCVPADLDEVPTFRLGIDGSDLLINGELASAQVPGDGGGGGARPWRVPPPARTGSVPSITAKDAIHVHVEGDRCIRYLFAQRASASISRPSDRDRLGMRDAPVSPSSQRPAFGALPDGDWVVRVTAYFETGIAGSGGLVIGERYFRVRVGEGPLPTPGPSPTPRRDTRPALTPAVPCGEMPATGEVQVLLGASGSDPKPGAAEGAELPVVNVDLGDHFEIVTVDAACALSWTITVFDAESGDVVDIDTFLNPDDLVSVGSQNRWRYLAEVGAHDVVAALHLGPGLDVVRFWRVVGEDFTMPDVVLSGDDGASVKAEPGCGLSVELGNGYTDGEECGPLELPASIPELRVPAWSLVSLDVEGWDLRSWSGQCGHVADDGGGGAWFEWECSLGGFYGDAGMEPPGPAQFLARPGDQLIQLYVQGHNDAGTFNANLYVRIVGE